VFEFDGDRSHGNLELFESNAMPNKYSYLTTKELNKRTNWRRKQLIKMGYNVVQIWQNDCKYGIYFSRIDQGKNNPHKDLLDRIWDAQVAE
jgi:hypothetical protein